MITRDQTTHRFRLCRRCGQPKEPPRDRTTKLCIACECQTSCRHYEMAGVAPICQAGVDIVSLTAPLEGSGSRRPCYFIERGTPVHCERFEPVTAEECRAADAESARARDRIMATLPVIARIKREHAGSNWSGFVVCPICQGQLHLSHAASNGHVWGRCATPDCVAWME